jgi:peptide-methionine (S)-S-oxide reductase
VVRTRVGYAGGTKANPTYYSLGDHSETIQIDFDPSVIRYEQLLDLFWSCHRPDRAAQSTQYASRVFYHDEAQRALAEASKTRQEERLGVRLHTTIEPAGTFTLAEDYHQKYYLHGQSQLMAEVRGYYSSLDEIVHSTLAARLNGYVGGNDSEELLEAELDSYGLSDQGIAVLRRMVR